MIPKALSSLGDILPISSPGTREFAPPASHELGEGWASRNMDSKPPSARITFNARFLDQQVTGVQRYSNGMLSHLGTHFQSLRPHQPLSPIRGHLWEQSTLPWRSGKSLLWSPGNTGPLAKENQVITVHDASTLDHPEWFCDRFATWYRFLVPRLARRVRKIITVSNFSKERLVATCSVSADKVAVVHNAIDRHFHPVDPDVARQFRKRHGLERPYFLYVGSLEPRKNLSVLLKAWRQLSVTDCELVVAGAAGHVFREKGFAELPAGARLFGRVAEDELPMLFTGACFFIFPSLYEGFGFPPLEAMACGCPVISSNTSSLPEVCGPAFDATDAGSVGTALYFDPNDADQLLAHLRTALSMSQETIDRMKANGLRWAEQFNWDRCARETWKVVTELASS